MQELKITLFGIKPLSMNNIFVTSRTGHRFKSSTYKNFEKLVRSQMITFKDDIDLFNKHYDETKHYLNASYIFYYPIVTKKGKIGKNSMDVSNIVKTIEDITFSYLVMDDSQVISVSSTKVHSDNIRIQVQLNIRDLVHIQ